MRRRNQAEVGVVGSSPVWIRLLFAVTRIGAVLVPANTRFRIGDIEYLGRQGDYSTPITRDVSGPIDCLSMMREVVPESRAAGDDLNHPGTPGPVPRARAGSCACPDGRVLLLHEGPMRGLPAFFRVGHAPWRRLQCSTRPHRVRPPAPISPPRTCLLGYNRRGISGPRPERMQRE